MPVTNMLHQAELQMRSDKARVRRDLDECVIDRLQLNLRARGSWGRSPG